MGVSENAISVDFEHSAKDPITPGLVTPDIDVQASLDIVENLDAGMLSVTGRFTGVTQGDKTYSVKEWNELVRNFFNN